jgi:hypothetical protein
LLAVGGVAASLPGLAGWVDVWVLQPFSCISPLQWRAWGNWLLAVGGVAASLPGLAGGLMLGVCSNVKWLALQCKVGSQY